MSTQITTYQTAEYGKFLQLGEDSLFPPVSVVRLSYPDNSSAFPENSAVKPLSSLEIYPKYAVLSHIVNLDEISISISAENINVELGYLEDLTEIQNTLIEGISSEIVDIKEYIDELELNTYNTALATDDTVEQLINVNTRLDILTGKDFTVTVTSPVTAIIPKNENINVQFSNTPNIDAFGRLRVSNPLTLFDSSHRYRDNNLWSSLTAVGGSVSFNQNQGLIDMSVSNLSGSNVIRETTKAFSYQAGKSLLVMNTFIMAPSATNLRQRVGYFGQDNGIYVQLDDDTISFVERSLVNGSPSSETIVPLSNWNGDKLDGNGPSGFKLDITKAQIFWMDVEWLGVGTVRCGFVINGQFIVCHSFHHANLISSTYITTASLPLRYEIYNKNATSGSHTLKQVCSTAISEGGYELRGLQQAISVPINAPRTFGATNTYYPIISIRLKSTPDRLDAIVILTALSILGTGNGINYNWQIRASGITSGGTWDSAGNDSAVEYNITGTSYSGGRILASGFLNSSNQGSPNLDVLKEALFKFQLERNGLTKTPYEITLVAATDTVNGSGIFASMDWEEISR